LVALRTGVRASNELYGDFLFLERFFQIILLIEFNFDQ